jgi:hypothetical protein
VAGLNKVAIEAEGTCYINPLNMLVEILLRGIFRPFTACSADNGEHKECFHQFNFEGYYEFQNQTKDFAEGEGVKPPSED